MPTPSANLVVFYIAFRPYGLQVFADFVRSYREHGSGREHRLVLLCKGFSEASQLQEYEQLLDGIRYETLRVPNQGLDIAAYRHAAEEIGAEHYCFFNSRSVLKGDAWLEKLYSQAMGAGVGVASATGSWQSLYSDFPVHHRAARQGFSLLRTALRSSFVNRARHKLYYPPFPNVHVRTNAFLISREVWRQIKPGRMRTRVDTSRFESGVASLTMQIQGLNLKPIVVGNDGRGYAPVDWPRSGTFWQSEQENLLVADNQTARYAQADAAERAFLNGIAWLAPAGRAK